MITNAEFLVIINSIALAITTIGNTLDNAKLLSSFSILDMLVAYEGIQITWDSFWRYVDIMRNDA